MPELQLVYYQTSLDKSQSVCNVLAADLRRGFSGIIAGNVKEDGMRRIEQHGPFEIHGDHDMMQSLDELLRAFVEQRRMKIPGRYQPCYRVVA